jgi:uncharacterized protein YjdB
VLIDKFAESAGSPLAFLHMLGAGLGRTMLTVNSTKQNLTSTSAWTSSATAIATVGSGGLATSVAQGTATITATSGTIGGSATLTVTAAVLTSVAVTPSTASVAAGYTEQFTATGTYSNGTRQNLTTTANWTSAATAIATVKLHTGLATSVARDLSRLTKCPWEFARFPWRRNSDTRHI